MAKYKTAKDRLAAYAMGGVTKYAGGGTTPSPAPAPKKAPTKFDKAALKKKYATNPYLIGGGQNRYYWASMLDREFPLTGGTVRGGLYDAARANKIDPALLYGSAMEEGMSGAIDDKNWENASEAYVQWQEKNGKLAEQFPVDTFYNYGLDQFAGNVGTMIAKGYLPKDFKKNFTTFDIENEKGEKGKGSAFNTDANALMAKSAMMRMAQDQLDSYVGKNGVKLTPKQKEFFLLANYNGGEGNMRKMIDSYGKQGYLKDDKFLDPNFKPSNYGGIYKNVMARMQVADMLRNEGFLSDFATGGEAGDTGDEPPLSDQEKYYQSSAKLSYYKDQLNQQLKAKNPKGYQDFFKGLVDLRRSGDSTGAEKYVQESQWNDYLSPKEVKTALGDKYQDYLDSIQQVNSYNVAQGRQPLYGTVEGENDLTKLNYGRRFASLMVTPSYSASNKTRGTSYNRSYSYDPKTGTVDYTEQGDVNLRPSTLSVRKMAEGGEVEIPGMPDMSSSAGAGGGWALAGQLLPQIGNALQAIFTKPQQQTNQPIMNAQTARAMTSPYAMGGELGDIDDMQYQEWLQSMFDNQLIAEESLDSEQQDDVVMEGVDDEGIEDEEEDSFAMGGKAKGIHIKPSKRGTFTAAAKKHGKSVQGFASQVLANKGNYSSAMVKKANFARNAAKWKHAYGAYAEGGMTDIEVEGDEVVQTPDGDMQQMQGPTHENGGIDMTVPVGTKIYSDRLQLEGKSMQQRKKAREKKMRTAEETLEKNPHDFTARNTYNRIKQVYDMEEQQDMALQKVANKIYSPPQKAAFGDEVGDPWSDYMESLLGSPATKIPFLPGADHSQLPNQGSPLSTSATGRGANIEIPMTGARTAESIGLQTPTEESRYNTPDIPEEEPTYSGVGGFTTGDYIGMGANLFNAIAPIINTRNAAKATKPEMNRFKGFGKQALEANAKAQDFAGVNFANAKRDLDTASNSAVLRNRLGARSINTMRALDTVTDLNRNKAAAGLYGQYTNQLSGLLGQEGQLANQRDQMVMSGEQARDERQAQNTDNYYSNMAQNLVNFGTNIGNIGAQMNKHKANQDNADLISQLSEYFDFGRDQQGKLVLKNKGKRKS